MASLKFTNQEGKVIEIPYFKGDPGKGLTISGYYNTLEELKSAITSPEVGDAYGVGTIEPYDIYIYANGDWKNNGSWQGPKGDSWVPNVDEETGELTWVKNSAKEPSSANIRGPKGKTAYEYAVAGGYSESEEQFYIDLSKVERLGEIVNEHLGRTTNINESDTNYDTYMARGIAISNIDLEDGISELPSGCLYFVYSDEE